MKIIHTSDYARRRAAEYPPLEEQLEAILEGGQKLAALKARIADIKARYPKPVPRPVEGPVPSASQRHGLRNPEGPQHPEEEPDAG